MAPFLIPYFLLAYLTHSNISPVSIHLTCTALGLFPPDAAIDFLALVSSESLVPVL